MCHCDLLSDGQAKSTAPFTVSSGAGAIESGESIEDTLSIFGRDRGTVVAHRDHSTFSVNLQGD